MISRTPYSKLISQTASSYSLDATLVEAVVLQESGGHADAFRFEPKFYARYLAKLPAYRGMVPRRISSSYGLMQIMWVVAFELGFRGEPEALFVPATNLEWGCRKLGQLSIWAQHFKDTTPQQQTLAVLAAYNGGRADNEPGHTPLLRNGKYAESVMRLYAQLSQPAQV